MAICIIFAWLLFATLASLLLSFRYKRMEQRKAVYKLPPGPKKLPLIGNLHQVGRLAHHSLWQLSQKYGPLMYLELGSMPIVVISSAEMAKEVMKTHDLDFCSRPRLVAGSKFSYNCLDISFAPYGEYWREIRKICILELFSAKRVQSFQFIREEEISLMINSISLSSATPINLSRLMMTLATNIICRAAMGKKYQEGDYEKGIFHRLFTELQALLGSFYIADFFPSIGWMDKLTGLAGRLEKSFSMFDAFYEHVIGEHIDPERIRPEHEDIVDVLLRLQRDGHLTKDHIKAVLTDIFIAGTDTASATLEWAMAELARHPRLMKKAQEEIRASLGTKGKVEEGDLHQLQYLKSVVKETWRLHSPAPLLLPRESIRHSRIHGYDILPNTTLYVNAWGIAKDPKSWDDPEEFIPERFMDSSIDYKGHNFEFIPFGSGRRICPAINLGTLTVELALASMLYHFDWELPVGMTREDIDMNEAPGITVHKSSALHLVAINHHIKK
ncbi:cytochrome P450 71A1-like isoform X1 [Elaeis guineensis]|uniref:cytochrome P450 71A1-like isoform X1 n=1 Tax=Elaeis guineensis var. tenera TaxID=51953 RepID=UPI003C6D1489